MTHRQFLTWQQWLMDQWNVPTRTDHYLMQIAMHCDLPHLKQGTNVGLDQYNIPFEWKKAVAEEQDEVETGPRVGSFSQGNNGAEAEERTPNPTELERASQWAMSKWFGAVGGRVRVLKPGEE